MTFLNSSYSVETLINPYNHTNTVEEGVADDMNQFYDRKQKPEVYRGGEQVRLDAKKHFYRQTEEKIRSQRSRKYRTSSTN